MESWREKPRRIKQWDKNTSYAMFIDENGNDSKINLIFKSLTNNKEISEDDKYFTITGCIFEKKDYKDVLENIDKLKHKYWKNGKYYDSKLKQEKYVCFHSRDIRRHNGAFNEKLINHTCFVNDLSGVLKDTKCIVISITIDLQEYLKQGYLYNVYETAFDFLLERYIYATKNHRKGIIMLEARGKNEDEKLLKHIINVIDGGKKNIPSSELAEKISGVYFNPKWNEEYSHTFTGLEIADLFSYPIHQYVKYKKSNPAFDIVKVKIDKYPNFDNKGLKIFPKIKNG